jgi:sugar phosphate isomerase/epimerase
VQLSVITDEIASDVAHALDVCAELGIGVVELRTVDGQSVVDVAEDDLRALRALLDRGGFSVCAIGSPFLKCDRGVDHADVNARALRAAAILGAPVVRAFSFWREPDLSAVLDELGAALHDGAARAAEAGRTLALENEHDCNVASAAEVAAALAAADAPDLGVIWDAGNAAMLDPAAFAGLGGLDAICDRVVHVHLKDVTLDRTWVRIGDGVVDHDALLRFLAAHGYGGPLSIESHHERDGSSELATRDNVEAIRRIASEAGVALG